MCNCGPRRLRVDAHHNAHQGMAAAAPAAMPPPHAAPRARPVFEYVGATALTVIGPASGLRYRFERTGARLAVDPRDRGALDHVAQLRHHA